MCQIRACARCGALLLRKLLRKLLQALAQRHACAAYHTGTATCLSSTLRRRPGQVQSRRLARSSPASSARPAAPARAPAGRRAARPPRPRRPRLPPPPARPARRLAACRCHARRRAACCVRTSRLPLAVTGQETAGSLGVPVKLPPDKRQLEHGGRRLLSRAPAQKCKRDAPARCRARPSSSYGPIARLPLRRAAGRAQVRQQQVRMAAGLPRHR